MLRVNQIQLLNGKMISLEVKPGELIQITGANGAGKSLLLKTVAKLIPSTFSELNLNNRSHSDYRIEEWRSKILYVPPDFHFDPEFTIEHFMNEPFEFLVHKDLKCDFDYNVIFQDKETLLSELSSGQRQQISLLRALSLKPQVLLLDEPFSFMDLERRGFFGELFQKFLSEGKMIIFVSHVEFNFSSAQKIEI